MSISEDKELFGWCTSARQLGGSFVKAIAQTAFMADEENYALLRPVLLTLKEKYPKYEQDADEIRRIAQIEATEKWREDPPARPGWESDERSYMDRSGNDKEGG